MSVKILVGADLVPTERNFKAFKKGDTEALIGNELKKRLDAADFTIFNLEVPLADKAEPINKCGPNLIAPTDTIKGLQAINPHFFTLANNHILDQGKQGLDSTIKILDRVGIKHAGAGVNLNEACMAHVEEIHGIKVGIYCCAEYEFTIAGRNRAGANPFDPLESLDHVERLKGKTDYVMVLYHGGKEHYRYPSPHLQRVCRKLVDKGADLVVCQHSHCIGAMEQWKNGTIIYGQGNFLFDDDENEFWQTGLLIEIDLEKSKKALESRIIYYPLCKAKEKVRLANNKEREKILSDFSSRSKEIVDIERVEELYRKFSDSMIMNYLEAFAGKRTRHIIYRVINKISGHRFGKWYLNRIYKKIEKTKLRNFVECEAHRELLINGLGGGWNRKLNEILSARILGKRRNIYIPEMVDKKVVEQEKSRELRFYILVPVYKVEKYISNCIESVLQQTYQNFHMVLVNDGSPDNSEKICKEYSERDSRITVIHQDNRGQIAARETAVKYVRKLSGLENSYIIFLDSDDTLKRNALEIIQNAINTTACDMVIYGWDRVQNGIVVQPYKSKINFCGVVEEKRELYRIVFNDAGYNSLCRKAISAKLLSDVDYTEYYHVKYGEDLIQSIEYFKHCRRVFFLNRSLYNYTINLDSITHSESSFEIDNTAREITYEFLKRENVFTKSDWKQYRTYCISRIISDIKTILLLHANTTKKKCFFQEIYKSDYYNKYIKGFEYDKMSLGIRTVVYLLFKYRKYNILLLIGTVYNWVERKIYRFCRR